MLRSAVLWFLLAIVGLVAWLSWYRVERIHAEQQLQAASRKPLSVAVAPARTDTICKWVYGEGTARAARRDFLRFESSGKVVLIGTDDQGRELRAGSRVKGPADGELLGQLLAQLDRRETAEDFNMSQAQLAQAERRAESAEAALAQAEIELELARNNFQRMQHLQAKGVIAGQQFEEAKARFNNASSALQSSQSELHAARSAVIEAKARSRQSSVELERTAIFAPFDGVIAYMNVKRGDLYSPDLVDLGSERQMLATTPVVVVDPHIFEITLDLPSFDGMAVREGQQAFVAWGEGFAPQEVLNVLGDKDAPVIPAYVYSVSPAITPGGRTVQVKLRTDQGEGVLYDGMFVVAWIVVEHKPDAVLAPNAAWLYAKEQPYVFVVDTQNNTAERRSIVEGIEGVPDSEIVSGVAPGELLVTKGRHLLVDGAPVRIVEQEGQ